MKLIRDLLEGSDPEKTMIKVNGVWQELVNHNNDTFTVRQSDGKKHTYKKLRNYTKMDFKPEEVPKEFNKKKK